MTVYRQIQTVFRRLFLKLDTPKCACKKDIAPNDGKNSREELFMFKKSCKRSYLAIFDQFGGCFCPVFVKM
jgi:hypothetical protein